ncbi:MAG: Nif3-like dinuclear metal center hexameric protein [Planctomycetaceae bacterium]
MTTVAEIVTILELLAPPELAEDWDNTGLLIGRRDAAVGRVLTCLTLTPDVAAEAIADGYQLIVTHHPVLFRATKRITDDNSEGSMLLQLIEQQVAVYSPHTGYDSAANGINQQLAEAFGLENVRPLRPTNDVADLGGGRTGTLPAPFPLPEFLARVKQVTSAKYLEFCGRPDAKVSRVAVACGAAAEFLKDAVTLGCDTFVTGEARFHAALEARAAKINLILLGHFSSERPAVENLATMLSDRFPGLHVLASACETDPLTIFL